MGVGARIRADLGDRAAYRWVGSGGSFGASPLRQHIGLGGAERVDLEVTWPTGEVRRFPGIAANQRVRVTEGSPRLERLPYPRIPFK